MSKVKERVEVSVDEWKRKGRGPTPVTALPLSASSHQDEVEHDTVVVIAHVAAAAAVVKKQEKETYTLVFDTATTIRSLDAVQYRA